MLKTTNAEFHSIQVWFTASKLVVKKAAEARGNLIGNKIADKITSLSKTNSKEKKDERQEI